MRRFQIAFFLLLPFSVCAAAQNAAGAPQTSLAYVLDSAGQTVTAVDLGSGKTTGTVSVSGRDALGMFARAGLDTLLLTPDGSRLVRLDPGAQKFTVRFGLHPLEKSTATIIDTKTMQAAARVELGWGLSSFQLTPTRRCWSPYAPAISRRSPRKLCPARSLP